MGNTYNGSGIGGGQQNFEVTDTPVESAFKIAEGDAATYTVTSTDGPGADFSLNVPVVDCRADPEASISLVCPSTPAEGPVLVYTYQNNSQVPVDFSFVDTFGPDIVKSAAKDMAVPATETRALYEDQAVHAEAYADGVLLDSFDTPVDCAPPNHIVVSKTVVGGTGNPAFAFEVVCHPAGSPESTTVVATFNLHDGESKSVDLPNPNDLPYCNARELDPGPAWTVTESFNGAPITTRVRRGHLPQRHELHPRCHQHRRRRAHHDDVDDIDHHHDDPGRSFFGRRGRDAGRHDRTSAADPAGTAGSDRRPDSRDEPGADGI